MKMSIWPSGLAFTFAFARSVERHAPVWATAASVPAESAATGGTAGPSVATRFTTFNEMIRNSISVPRFRAALIAAFASLAVMLAMAGIYGVMTYSVSERNAEMGLRMALGADRTSIVALTRQALLLAITGLAIGVAAAIALSRVSESLLYGVHALLTCRRTASASGLCSSSSWPLL